jgi:ribosomal-protein-alanine N-acetyltransferase
LSPSSAEADILTRYALLPMESEHLEQVIRIEELSYSNPWKRRAFEYEIGNNPMSWPRVLVAKGEPVVAGYCVVWFVFEHVQIQNVAVHPDNRRQGLGRFLVLRALEEGVLRGAQSALLEVRRSNAAAQALYRALGFLESGVRRDYYSLPREDALVFKRELARE